MNSFWYLSWHCFQCLHFLLSVAAIAGSRSMCKVDIDIPSHQSIAPNLLFFFQIAPEWREKNGKKVNK